jgi:hypothetical protein
MLSNNPPPAAELFAEEIYSLNERAENFGPVSDDNAGEARDLIGIAKKLAKDIDAKRDEEKRPHLDAGREIDGTYKPLVESAKYACSTLEKSLTEFIVEQKRKAEEIRRAAEAKAAEEDAKAKALADDALLGESTAEAAQEAANAAEIATAKEKMAGNVKGSEGFRAAGLRTIRKATVTDQAKLIFHYHSHPDVMEVCLRLANAEIRAAKGAPISIPGIEVVETEVLV